MSRPRRRARSRAARQWVTNGFSLNAKLRGDEALLAEMPLEAGVDPEALTRELEGAMRPLHSHRRLYRGTTDPETIYGLEEGGLRDYEYIDPGFVSTTTDPGVAERFEGGATLRIDAGPGVPYLDLEDLNEQREVVLGRGLRHRVTGEEVIGGRRFIDVEVSPPERRRRRRRLPWIAGALAAAVAAIVAVLLTTMMALLGADLSSCQAGGGSIATGALPGGGAAREIPAPRLHLYIGAARRFDLSWPFLASIGVQECGTDGHCGVAPSGCAGVMEIAYVRGSACSPDPTAPTLWERFKVDADGGGASIFDPADSIYTAAHFMRAGLSAPPAGGSYAGYHQVACSYYGACADSVSDYADEVMARAKRYGFGQEGAGGATQEAPPAPAGPICGGRASWGGGGSGAAIVRIARSQLGTSEFPPGSNCTRYGPCEEWCALFVAWVWQHAGIEMAGGTAPFANSASFYHWVKEHGGRDLPPTATPAPGDAVIYGWGPNSGAHVGIVESVFGPEITTIEGNWGDRVSRVGPFLPALARVDGEPAPIFAYAEPPGPGGQTGGDGHG